MSEFNAMTPFLNLNSRAKEDITGLGGKHAQAFNDNVDNALKAYEQAGQHLDAQLLANNYNKTKSDYANWLVNQGYTRPQREQMMNEWEATAYNPYERSWGEAVTDAFKQFGSGGANLIGSAANGLGFDGAADSLWKTAEDWNRAQSSSIQLQTAEAESQYQANVASGMNSATAAIKMYKDNPRLIGKLVAEQLPQAAIAAIPVVGGAALVGTNAAAGAGNVRKSVSEAWESLTPEQAMTHPLIQERMVRGMTFEQALEDAKNDYSDNLGYIAAGAAIGAGTTLLSPLSKLGKGVNRGVGATVAKEVGTEALQGGAEQVNQNLAKRTVDGTTEWNNDLGRAMVEEGLGGLAFSAPVAYDAYRNGKQVKAKVEEKPDVGDIPNNDTKERETAGVEGKDIESNEAVPVPDEVAPTVDMDALNKALSGVNDSRKQSLFTKALNRDVENGEVHNKTGKGEYDKFVQRYLAILNGEEVKVGEQEIADPTMERLLQLRERMNGWRNGSKVGKISDLVSTPMTFANEDAKRVFALERAFSEIKQEAEKQGINPDDGNAIRQWLDNYAEQRKNSESDQNKAKQLDTFFNDKPVVMQGLALELEQGAPSTTKPAGEVASEIQQPTNAIQGKQAPIELGSQGTKQAQYQLVEADELTVNLKPNAYQNRDRTSAESQAQIIEYANNLNPSYLGASVDTTQGAPTVDSDYGVFAGNGRLSAIKQAYAQNPEKATAYRDYLAENAEQFGLSAEQVQGMKQPVLVRQVQGDIDVKKAVEESNFNTGLDKGVLGNAKENAKYIDDNLLDLVETNEDGSLNLSESNTPFITGLVAKIPVEQRPQFFAQKKLGNQTQYTLTAQGRELVENALLVKAYSDGSSYADNLLSDLITGTDDGNKRVKQALISVAGKVSQTKGTDYDIAPEIIQAYDLMTNGKKAGLNAQEVANQGDFLNPPSEFTKGLVERFYSPKSVSEVQQPLNDYLDKVINSNLNNSQQESMFGDDFNPSREELLRDSGMRANQAQVGQVRSAISTSETQGNTAFAKERQALNRLLGEGLAKEVALIQRNEIAKHINVNGLNTERIRGFFDPKTGQLHIVPENIGRAAFLSSEQALAWVAWHELSHKGLGGRYGQQLQNVLNNAGKNKLVREIALATQRNINPNLTYTQAVEEAIVELSSAMHSGKWEQVENDYGVRIRNYWKNDKGLHSQVSRLIGAVERALRRIAGAVIGKDLTKADNRAIFDLLKGLQGDVRNLGNQESQYTKNRDLRGIDNVARYSLDESTNSAFAKAVDDVANGNRTAQQIIDVGTTPDVLKMLGLPDVDVVVHTKTLSKVMQDKHNVSPETLKQLPKQINNPVAVMKSETQPNGYVVLTELTERENGKDKPVIAALHLKQDKNGLELINIASVYGRSNAQIQRGLDNDLLYWNNKKGADFLNNFTLQLRSSLSENSSIGRDIKTEADLSQYRKENSVRYSRKSQNLSETAYNQAKAEGKTELTFQQWKQVRSPEFKRWFGDWENDPENASKVVNPKTGEPLVVYHGTNAEFFEFDTERTFGGNYGVGSYFTSSQKDAGQYGDVKGFFLNIKKPDTWHNAGDFDNKIGIANQQNLSYYDYSRKNFDGIRVTNPVSYNETQEIGKHFVVFNPNQIKSATDNNGEFDGRNPDVRYSLRPKSESLEKLRQSETIRISGKEIEPSSDLRQYKRNALEYGKTLRGTYVNKDTGQEISLGLAAVKEVLNHDYKNSEHLQSISAIPQIVENAVYIDTLPNNEVAKNSNIESYDYYVAGLDIGGKEYTVKAVVANDKDGNRYYDHKLSNIAKGDLLSTTGITTPSLENKSPLSEIDDKRLLQILQDNSENDPKFSLKSPYPQKKMTAREVVEAEKINQHPSKFERVKNGGFKQVMEEMSAEIDRKYHDRLRPVMDWIKGLDIVGVGNYEKQLLQESIYKAEGVRQDYIVRANKLHLDSIRDDVAKFAEKYFGKDGETAMKKVGLWISQRWAIEQNELFIARDLKAMEDVKLDLDIARVNGEPKQVTDRLELKLLEAQEKLAKRIQAVNNPDLSDGVKHIIGVAGGWSTPKAKYLMAELEKTIPRQELEAFAEKIYDLNEWRLEEGVNTGRYTRQEVREYLKKRHYVPLTGDPDMAIDEDMRMPSERNPNAPKEYSADGRTDSEADDAITTMWEAVVKDSVFDGWAEVKQRFSDVYEKAVEEQVALGSTRKEAGEYVAENLGISKRPVQGLTRIGDNVLIHREKNGKRYEIALPDVVIQQIKKQNSESMAEITGFLNHATRYLSKAVTQWKPHFALTNAIRDIHEKSEIIRTKEIYDSSGRKLSNKEKDAIGRDMIKTALSVLGAGVIGKNKEIVSAAWRYAWGKPLRDGVPMEAELKRLLTEGGVSTHSLFLERKETDLIKSINKRNSKVAKGIEYINDVVLAYNSFFEIISSISANKALLNAGVDPKHAAGITLDLTNFRKQGDKMPNLRPLYMFAQPTAIGGANLIRGLKTRHGQKRLAIMTLTSSAIAFMLQAAGDNDEVGNDLFKEGDIDRFIPIPLPNGMIFKMPVGFGLPQLAWNMGVNLTQALMGDKTWGQAGASVALHMVKAVAPVSPSDVPVTENLTGKLVTTATPTIAQPLVQNFAGINAFGMPLNRGFINDNALRSEQGREQTAEFWHDVAKHIHRLTGNTFDPTPEEVRNIVRGYANLIPLANEMITMTVENPNRERLGKPPVIPFINPLVSYRNIYATQSQYYTYVDKAKDTRNTYESYVKDGNLPESMRKDLDVRWQMNWLDKAEKAEKARQKQVLALKKRLKANQISEQAYNAERNRISKQGEVEMKKLVGQWRYHYGLRTTATSD